MAPVERTLDADRDPFERQTWETGRAFGAFTRFRDAGIDRTVIGAYRSWSGRPEAKAESVPGHFREWRARNLWDERAAHFDREQDRLQRMRNAKGIAAMRERQAQAGVTLQLRSLTVLGRVLPSERELADAADPKAVVAALLEQVSPAELLRAFDLGSRTERLARGEPTEIGEHAVRATVRGMSDDEARAFSGLDE